MKLRVKSRGRVDDAEHANVLRKPDVERPLHRRRGEIDVDVHARDLSERMHARIGPAGARDRRSAPAVERRERLLDDLLNREAVELPLPADVVGAVVSNGELQRAHRQAWKPASQEAWKFKTD